VRFCLPITPYATQLFTPYVLGLSVAAILYGGLAALAQTDLKKLVAYSSVGHMGFVTLGIFLLSPSGIEGALLQMVNHGITTGALFIGVGIIYERLHTRELAAAAGMGKHMPRFAAFLGVFALSSLAFPGTNSFISEFLVLSAGFAWSKWLMLCVVPGVVLVAAYMLRMLQTTAYGGVANPDHSRLKDLEWREVLSLAPLLVLVFWIGLQPQPFMQVFHASVDRLVDQVEQPVAATERPSAGQTLPFASRGRPQQRPAAALLDGRAGQRDQAPQVGKPSPPQPEIPALRGKWDQAAARQSADQPPRALAANQQ
jgi:NADH-quinone oxidoreductase subunit M